MDLQGAHFDPTAERCSSDRSPAAETPETPTDVYFSADVETDGSIPGPYSMLSFAIVKAGTFDGTKFVRPYSYEAAFYQELRPISESFEPEALAVNGLDRARLVAHGTAPELAMTQASEWVAAASRGGRPVLVAYPLSFDWMWLYWYFVRYSRRDSRQSNRSLIPKR